MAIVDGCPGLACEIVVDGQAVTEYLDEDEPEANNTVIRYVEAQSGKVFAIKSKFNDLFPQKLAVKASFFLDGRWTQNKNYTPERLKGDHICKGPVSTIGNQSFQQNYMFKELVTTDEDFDLSKELVAQVNNTGTIKVEFWWGRAEEYNYTEGRQPQFSQDLGRVPEKDMKGDVKSHQAAFTEPQIRNPVTYVHRDRIGERPFAIFIFKYRSLAILRALQPLPREDTPLSLEDRQAGDLSKDELREFIRRHRDRDEAGTTVNEEEREEEIFIKKEEPPSP